MPRIHQPSPMQPGQVLALSATGARHVQVLRLQPGDTLTLFGDPVAGGEYTATVERMGRSEVTVRVGQYWALDRLPVREVHLAVGMPANDRMDWLVEKATELGVASIQPLVTSRSVLRLQGERADKKVAHWQAVAVAACEQCGGNRVPIIHPVAPLEAWQVSPSVHGASVWQGMLSLSPGVSPLRDAAAQVPPDMPMWLLHGPEGGLTAAEEHGLLARGFAPVSLGPRVLRAETAAIAGLAALLI